ncbi:hypothetical protein [Clostridium sp. C2-6-12]|uniref:hypothetical protein n=1 Tax=Clostridium sp. C2-6-12 TaxID=2698832 RepID=UPI00136C6C78|nr:hypothetical protein [Clostridium sp. C2-6-12]
MKKYNDIRQIIKIDKKNGFLEVMNSSFGIGKVQINFREYDENKEKGNRLTKEIDLFMDIGKFFVFTNDVLNGRVAKLADIERNRAKQESDKLGKTVYPKELDIYTDMGGLNAENLKKSDAKRKAKGLKSLTEMYAIPEGKALSRQLKIVPGIKAPFVLKAEVGSGEESDTGLIIPKYGNKPEQVIIIPMQVDDLKRFVLIVNAHINAFLTSTYIQSVDNYKII